MTSHDAVRVGAAALLAALAALILVRALADLRELIREDDSGHVTIPTVVTTEPERMPRLNAWLPPCAEARFTLTCKA